MWPQYYIYQKVDFDFKIYIITKKKIKKNKNGKIKDIKIL